MNKELIEHLLGYDVITEAEKITTKSYKDDGLTQRVAALNFIKRNQKLAKELKTSEDTYRGITYLNFVNLVMKEGFRPCFNESFTGGGYGDKPVTEMFLVFYHEAKGILLTAESFAGSLVNRAEMYYNWVPNQKDAEWYRASGSGGFDKTGLVWAGHCEVNEALKYKLDLMHRKGYFCQWVEKPHLWLVNYTEARTQKDYDAINQRKIVKFPEIVRKGILS